MNLLHPWLSGVTTRSTTNPPATTYIVVGSAGNHENHEPFTRKAPPSTHFTIETPTDTLAPPKFVMKDGEPVVRKLFHFFPGSAPQLTGVNREWICQCIALLSSCSVLVLRGRMIVRRILIMIIC